MTEPVAAMTSAYFSSVSVAPQYKYPKIKEESNKGIVKNDSKIRVIRDGIVKYDGEIASLKRFKDDVKEVKQGNDCGLTIKDYNDIKVGDEFEVYEMQQVEPK